MEQTKVFDISSPATGDRRAAAILVAAGSFSRMGGIPKQMIPLKGMPVIAHTIRAFQKARHIREIVLVARSQDVDSFALICRQYSFDKVSFIVTGGATRQDSVSSGVRCVSEAAYYAIHDGARPLILPETIDSVVEAAWQHGAATAAVRVKDTIKIADDNGFVLETPERSHIWSVQTPQAFEQKMYLYALEQAGVKGYSFTDDCQLVEMIGGKVFLVEGDYGNIKITTPEDIPFAEGILCSIERKRNEVYGNIEM